MDDKLEERGSAKIFDLPQTDRKALAMALTNAREHFEVKWWWKYGQPKIDLIRARIDVRSEVLGQVVTEIMQLNDRGMQATLTATPGVDGTQLDVTLNRSA